MKKRKSIVCIAACLLALLAVGCKKGKDETVTTAEIPAVTVEETEAREETEPEETEGETVAPETDASETTAAPQETEEPETYPEIILPTDPSGVVDLIDSIPSGTSETEWDIDRAYAAWAALSEADRAKVTNYDRLRELLQQVADAHIVKDYHGDRIPHGELLLGAYYGPTPTDERLQVAVDAYLDFFCAVSNDKATLDQYQKFGLGAIVTGYSFGVPNFQVGGGWRLEGQGPVNTARSIKKMELMLESVSGVAAKDHEALWGIDYRDEPGSGDFWFYEYILSAANAGYPQVQTFANLLPNYGNETQLGTYGYSRHVRDYAHRVAGDILSFDHYIYDTAMVYGQVTLFRGLEDLYQAARDTDKDVMAILQLNRNRDDRLTTLGEIKFQAYTSMAYGAKYIIWGCYNGGWFNSQALDANQEPTEQYYKMQECNRDLKTLSPIFMRYTATGQTMLNTSMLRDFIAARHPLDTLGIKTIADLTASDTTKDLLVGYFEKNLGEGEAFLFVNTATFDQGGTNTETSVVTFRTVSPASVVTAYVGGIPTILTPVDGLYTVEIVDADAVFVTVTEPESLIEEFVAPVESILIGGTDIGEFTIVIPAAATQREQQAAEVLASIILDATGKTLPIVTDTQTPAHAIVLGKAALTTSTLDSLRAELVGDGYVVRLENGNLYISGNDVAGAGTLFGVYAFCEEQLGICTYADGYTVYDLARVELADGFSHTHNPSFVYRDSTNYVAMDQSMPLFRKYNGYSMLGDVNFGAAQFGGYALNRLCGVDEKYDEQTVCLANESVYALALENAKYILSAHPNSEYLGCDIGLGGEWNPCTCGACTEGVATHGVLGYTLQFANRLAADIQAEYPDVLVVITAAGENIGVPATVRPAENVAVRVVMPETACRFHALGDENCEVNASLCQALEDWTEVCDHVILLDQVTHRAVHQKDYQGFSGNLLALYDTVQYLRGLGVVGYQQMGYDTYTGEFEAMNAYLLSRLLWDADMTREEYSAEMDGFLAAYYGKAAPYIRQYIDKMYANEGMKHSDYKNDNAMIYRTGDKSFGLDCMDLWRQAVEAADTAETVRNTEYSSVQMLSVAQAIRDSGGTSYFRKLMMRYGFATS